MDLQRRQPDGTWSEDLTSGASGGRSEEQLRAVMLGSGRYRVEVHNFAGPPATRVDLALTFVNSADERGPDA